MAMLIIYLVAMTLSTAFNLDPGLGPGLSVKNVILYLLAMDMVVKLASNRRFKLELPGMLAVFAALIIYAIASYVLVVLVVDYPRYDALAEAMALKQLIDQPLVFAVFLYGVRSNDDAVLVLKCLAGSFALSHIMALLDAVGLMHIGDIELRSDGRVQGLMGESNQYGAFAALSVPATMSLVAVTRGAWRMFWGTMVLIAAVTLLMTVSRGAFVATTVAFTCGFFLLKKYLPSQRFWLMFVLSAAVLLVGIALGIAAGYGELIYDRVIAETRSGGVGSDRTSTWAAAIGMMMDEPITLLTGFGWRSYWVMPFKYSPHNYYVNLWFNLGVVGLASAILLFAIPIRRALTSLRSADVSARAILIGFIVSTIAYAVATFFVDLYVPWMYFWAYAGMALRVALNAETKPDYARSPAPERGSPYGWVAARQ